MKNLIVYYHESGDLQTKIEDTPIPSPAAHEILIKVYAAGCNPKDFKHPVPQLYNNAVNQGDDCAGIVVAVGKNVKSFQIGQRVAGFHVMDTPNGCYAEYALCPANTVFRIPENMSFEEAATLPLAAYTATIGLWRNLQVPAPWERRDDHAPEQETVPVIVNGAGGAVGAFAIKLAKMNPRISPLIAIASASIDYVKSLGVDAVLNYRSPTITDDIRKALNGKKVAHVFDAVNSLTSIEYLVPNMETGAKYTCTGALNAMPELGIDDKMEKALNGINALYEITFAGDVHEEAFLGDKSRFPTYAGGRLFGRMISLLFEQALIDGTLTGHPYLVVEKGFEGVLDALKELAERKRSGNEKFW